MSDCPHCKGRGYIENAHEPQCVMSYNDYCECQGERITICWICEGTGKISAVALAVYKIRGGRAFS